MDDLISRRDAIDALKQQAETMSEWSNRYVEQKKGVLTAVNIIEDLPSAQPERNGGKWMYDKGLYKCSSCNELWTHWWAAVCPEERMYKWMKYCPNCGARMDGDENG